MPTTISDREIDVVGQQRKTADQQPKHGAGHQIDRLDRAPIENARARPGHREGGEQQRIGKIDTDEVGDRPVHSEQGDRSKPDQMGKAPPADGAQRHVLRPHEKQQQAEDGLDVDRHQKKRVDVECHRVLADLSGALNPVLAPTATNRRPRPEKTDECAYSRRS